MSYVPFSGMFIKALLRDLLRPVRIAQNVSRGPIRLSLADGVDRESV